jgi:hypothetical protein
MAKLLNYLPKQISARSGLALLLLAIGVLLIAASLFYLDPHLFLRQRAIATGVDHVITRTRSGFVPSSITITQGDTITFKSELKDPFWPASNVHPSHSIYPEFDPKTRIFPPNSWTFEFDKVGHWGFHDHLSPNFEGVITVLSKDGKENSQNSLNCDTVSPTDKIQCMDQKLEDILATGGVKEAFDYFVDIYNKDPEVAGVCHGWAHRLGEADYQKYKEGKDIELRPEATFCSYGYFHGFIAAMVNDTQSLDGANAFCDLAVKKVGDQLKGLKGNCVHGIGHGITGIVEEEPENWGNFKRMAHEGIIMCDKLYQDNKDQTACVDGMYHEMHLNIINNEYGMNLQKFLDTKDLFYYCAMIADEPHGDSCYYDFVDLWPYFFNDNMEAAAQYMLDHMPHLSEYGPRILNTFARSFIQLDITRGHYEHSIAACRLMPEYLLDSCMNGLANGFVEHGEPDKQYIAGFAFCRNDLLTTAERHSCFINMANMLWWSYTPDLFAQACATLAPDEKEKTGRCGMPQDTVNTIVQ